MSRILVALLLASALVGCSAKSHKALEPDASAQSDADTADAHSSSDDVGGNADDVNLRDAAADATRPEDSGPDASTTVHKVLSVEQYGITWTFDAEVEAGQFITGDWWVVGPVTVVSVTPEPTGSRNGSMLNPVDEQAYDSRGGEYDGSKAESFPLLIAADNSLVSSISHPEASECDQGGTAGWETYSGSCQRGPIATQAVLTVVAAPVPDGTFRPGYATPTKRYPHVDEVAFDRLPSHPAPDSAPDGARVLRDFERPWIDHLGSWTMQHGCATLNMFCYGREIGNIVSRGAGFVLLDTPEQRDVAIRLIQLGIDNFGVVEAGGGWHGDGGHFNGRKFPIVFAGILLGDAAMASPGSERVGNEDLMTYYGADGTALWGRDCNSCYLAAGCENNDSCQSGARDCRDPAGLIDGCSSYRNCCTSTTWVGEALAIHQLGAVDDWDHPPFFDYVDRWMNDEVAGASGASDFIEELWATYR